MRLFGDRISELDEILSVKVVGEGDTRQECVGLLNCTEFVIG